MTDSTPLVGGHTPGPLHVRKAPGNIIPPFFDVEHEDRPGCIARVFAGDNAEVDANLYAAAPEMLAALKAARAQIIACHLTAGLNLDTAIANIDPKIDEALAKATGVHPHE